MTQMEYHTKSEIEKSKLIKEVSLYGTAATSESEHATLSPDKTLFKVSGYGLKYQHNTLRNSALELQSLSEL